MSIKASPRKHLWVWFLWLAVFYSTWLLLLQAEGAWEAAKGHWPMALAMAIGSYAAGSTPMGGGTVGFPVLVLLFDMPATLGRDFSFAVQSIGMVSASIFILARRQPLAWAMLKGAVVGALIGAPIGIIFFAPLVPDLWIKVVFAVLWGSFGVLHLYRIGEIAGHVGMTEFDEQWDHRVGFMLGLVASLLAVSVTGVGIDMVIYAALVLLCRADLKIAIPTSVVIMAFTSVYGVAIKTLTNSWQPGVYENWLAAAPVVALGAPLGVFIVERIGRKPILMVVAALCVGQFIWTCFAEQDALGVWGIALSLAALGLCLMVFEKLRSWGGILVAEAQRKNDQRRAPPEAAPEPFINPDEPAVTKST
ncbi:sulfite exporter TauE/SafE family protein [Marinimicrobium sp. ABcell2]|uniref:sulfite exporter TauE/SafE family protein n=1 Tax=Marinimicrobium sp. ABcell2 TaxID=3069751 RepID=UPI0027B2B5C2|nr:sulfite exporter TauE/SafE family protein [Marinimicrobium sp. ABcell2]MDQ2075966.1 sulfite exporter TauE/SafE family protein [Marinimicrobium sp. ABcell2]